MQLLVSIILPVYNGEQYLKQAIESVLNQTYTNFELIIVNDCSTDNTAVIIESFVRIDTRIKVINNKENKKLPASLNIGHNIATGDYMTWTSHDNILKPNFIEILLKYIQQKQVDIVYSNYEVINEYGKVNSENKTGPLEHLLFGNKVGASFLYHKKVFQDLKYNEAFFLMEDYDFWLRAALKYKFQHINESLYQYRIHSRSLTADIINNKTFNLKQRDASILLFSEFSKYFNWNDITKELLINNRLGYPISLSNYIKFKNIIKTDLLEFGSSFMVKDKIIVGLLFSLRYKLISEKNNHNIKMLAKILLYERKLLFHKSFSKKKTLKLIWNCLF